MVFWIKDIRELEIIHAGIACNIPCLICWEKVLYPMEVENLDSPFSPRSTSPNLFVGREKEILEFRRTIMTIKKGKRDAVVVKGIRGIGKSTFSAYMSSVLKESYKIETLTVDLGALGSNDFSDKFPTLVQERLASKIAESKGIWKKIGKKIYTSVKEVDISAFGIIGAKVNFNDEQKKRLSNISLLEYTITAYTQELVKEGKIGFALILDSINGLSKNEVFPNYLKGMLETFDRIESGMPFMLILNIIPENWKHMIQNQESLARDCVPINLDQLTEEIVTQFYKESFRDAGLEIEEKAVTLLSQLSGGFPMFMQEIGDATFWIAKNQEDNTKIDENLAWEGINQAMKRIGELFFSKKLDRLQSLKYSNILKSKEFKLLGPRFEEEQIQEITVSSNLEKNDLKEFLIDMKESNILKFNAVTGIYEFTSALLYVYLTIYYIPIILDKEQDYDIESTVKSLGRMHI